MKGLFLFIIACLIGGIVIPISIAYGAVTIMFKNLYLNFNKKNIKVSLVFGFFLGLTDYNLYFRNIAISIDQSGNTAGYKLFNDILIKPGGHRFGNPDETISSVLGKNQLTNTLTLAGKFLNWCLDKRDPGHSLKSIEQ